MKVWIVLTPTYCGYGDHKILAIFKIKSDADDYAMIQVDHCIVEEWEVIQ